jgi:hypothetical protein
VSLELEKGERVTRGGKGKGEIRGEAGEVTGVVANVPIFDGLGKKVWNVQWKGDGSWKSGGIAGG